MDAGAGRREPLLELAAGLGLPLLELSAWEPVPELPAALGIELLSRLQVWPLARRGGRLWVAVGDPRQLASLGELRFHGDALIQPVLADPAAVAQALESWQARADTASSEPSLDTGEGNAGEGEDDGPVVRFVDSILLEAVRRGASDVHVEPYEDHCRVRLRIDGMLRQVARAPLIQARRIAARLKVMAQLDIAERQLPQDGRIKLSVAGRQLDGRLSSLPTLFGEKLVLRILDGNSGRFGIDALGLEPEQRQRMLAAIDRPNGLMLVTGPTGSGKTVTLYAALERLNQETRNIATVEDPVEIRLPGVNQVQRNARRGLGFATALRAFLRQDPDVIMVGEIRDLETAEIAIKAAQTGHLVLSTLHTNDAPQALVRLRNMGIADYNIAGSVTLVTAQRLLRRLCPRCRRPHPLPPQALQAAGFSANQISEGVQLYQAVGCADCNEGYRGRLAVHQVLPISAALSALLVAGADVAALTAAARANGVDDLRQVALRRAREGLTSLAEVERVTRE